MHLWNDYEGKTIAGAYTLGNLLRTEGRSASFATRMEAGQPAVIRLTETLNDAQEMRARYRAIQAAAHPNLLEIEDFGEAEFEGTPLLYVVTEQTEESLAEILEVRRLSVEETGEVALSVLGGLETLHAHGLVHGLVGPASVLAVGERIKLRTDCVRPAPEGGEGARERYEDVFGLADVLNRSLTQQHLVDASDALALPEPYASVVRNVVRGTWGLEQVGSELGRHVRQSAATASVVPLPAAVAAQRAPARLQTRAVTPVADVRASTRGGGGVASPEAPTFADSLAAANRVFDKAALAAATPGETGPEPLEANPQGRAANRAAGIHPQLPLVYAESGEPSEQEQHEVAREPMAEERRRRMVWIAGGTAALLVLLLLLWFGKSGSQPKTGASASAANPVTATQPSVASAPAPPPMVVAPHVTVAPAIVAKPGPTPAADAAPPAGARIWRVVAYTYNRQEQAEAKTRLVADRHADLRPQVFSPTGRAPYLVTLGGPLSQQAAATMRQRARAAGLARDVYMQNYSH